MGAFEKITVSVPAEVAESLRQSVEKGEYLTENEIVRDALSDWARQRDAAQAKVEWLRQTLAKADEGPWFSEEEAFAQVEAAIARHDKL